MKLFSFLPSALLLFPLCELLEKKYMKGAACQDRDRGGGSVDLGGEIGG